MIKIIHKVFLLILFIFLENVYTKEIIVFAAADLVYTLNEVKDLYNQKNLWFFWKRIQSNPPWCTHRYIFFC